MTIVLKLLFIFLLFLGNSHAKIKSIDTREDIKQLFDVIKPKNSTEPTASVILFAGGGGYLKMDQENWKKKGNFLVRSRKLFMKNNLAVAVIDAPSDYRTKDGMPAYFRTSSKHVEDVEAVIKFMKKRFKKPVWLVGTSRGTLSAAYVAIKSKGYVDGVVLTSSITKPNKKGTLRPISELSLYSLTVPILIAHHKYDSCYASLSYDIKSVFNQLNTSIKELKLFEGGVKGNDPCKGRSYHGFYKIEKEVVDYISKFIENNSK